MFPLSAENSASAAQPPSPLAKLEGSACFRDWRRISSGTLSCANRRRFGPLLYPVARIFSGTSDAFVWLRGWERASRPGLHCHHDLSTVQSVSFRTLRGGQEKNEKRGRRSTTYPSPCSGTGSSQPPKILGVASRIQRPTRARLPLSNRLFAEHACLLASCGAADQLLDA